MDNNQAPEYFTTIRVSDIMSRKVIVVDEQCMVLTAVKKMSMLNVGAVIVSNGARKALGIFTERDIMNRVVAKERDPASTLVTDVMTKNLKTFPSNTHISKVFRFCHQEGIRHAVIVDDGVLTGIVSVRDINKAIVDVLEKLIFE